jgi:modulator of FtsH protease HflC
VDKGLNRLRMLMGGLALAALAYAACAVPVREGEAGIRTRLGQPMEVWQEAGLGFKLPWPLEEVVRVDIRKRVFQTRHTEMLTRDKKNIVLLSNAVWSVEDPLLFFQSAGSSSLAEEKLDGLITNAKIGILGRYDLSALASTVPGELRVEQIEQELLEATEESALANYGIRIHSVGFSRLSLPQENVKAVFKQMRAERKQYAAEFEAKGEKEASMLRSQTDLEVAGIRAAATEQAARIRGEADAEAARIYSEAHRKDPSLYRFVRSLDTLDETVGARSTIILRTDSEPFRLLSQSR